MKIGHLGRLRGLFSLFVEDFSFLFSLSTACSLKSTRMNTSIVTVENVTHHFGKQTVLDNLNLNIPPGSIYGFLGPNGAGKTTSLRLILGLLQTQQGQVSVFGKDIRTQRLDILRRVGSLIEQPSLYGHLNARENLEVFRLSYQTDPKRIDEVLSITGLTGAARKKVKAFSLGMKQRLGVAMALLHNPDLLILDEPTNGLDPNGIIETRDLIKQLNQEHGKTIIVSSHLLDEIEKMVTNLAIIHKGKKLFEGTIDQLRSTRAGQSFIELEVSHTDSALKVLSESFSVEQVHDKILVAYDHREQVPIVVERLVQQNIKIYQLSVQQKDLEKLFVQIISG